GISVRAPSSALKQVSQDRALLNIVAASRIRMRRVALRGQWWQEDNGPMLAYLDPERRPVALLPTSPRSYVLHDPADDSRVPIHAALARRLDFIAVSFYRSLPNRSLKAADLIRFGLHACRRDLILLMLMGTLVGLLGLVPPIAIGAVFDSIIPSAQASLLL